MIAIYVRVSTVDKGQDTAMQVTACKEWMRRNGRENDEFKIYEDRMSGRKASRPSYQLMIDDVRAGKIKLVLAYKLDRLSRSLQDLLKFSKAIKESGASFLIATQPELNGDLKSAMSIMLFQILGVFAEFESNIIAERVRSGMAEGKRNGKTYGGDRNSVLKRVTIISRELKPNEATGKRWSLLQIRKKLKYDRTKFYAAIEFLERESGKAITDYSDERYSASCRGFKYKRVDRHGKYLNANDPRLVAAIEKREQAVDLEVENLEEYIEKLDKAERVESTVDFILRDKPRLPAAPIKFKIKTPAEIEAEKANSK